MELEISPVQIVRDSISTITQVLAERDVPVYQRGMKAYVCYADDGSPRYVSLPYLPDDASDQLITSVQGFLDHEVGHLLFTDSSLLKGIAYDPQLLEMQNILEDPYVERKMRQRFPGSRQNLNNLYEFFTEKLVLPRLEQLIESGDASPLAYMGALLPCMARAWCGFDHFVEFMNDKWEYVQPIVDKVHKLHPELLDDLPKTKNTAENIVCAKKLLEATMYVPEGDYSEGDFDDEEGIIDGETMIDEEGGLDDRKEKSKGGSSSDKSSSLSSEKGDSESESGEEDSGPSAEEKSGGESFDEELDELDELDEETGSGSVTDDEESDKESDEGDSDKPDEDDKVAEFEGAKFDEDEHKEVSDDVIETNLDVHVEDDESEKAEEEKAEEEKAEEEKAEEEKAEEKMYAPEEGEEFTDHSIGDMDKCMGDAISDEAIDCAKSSEYVIYSTDKDEIEPVKIPKEHESRAARAVKEIDNHVADFIGTMITDLERAFVAENKSYWRSGQYSGRVNAASLARIRTGDMRVFRRKVEHHTKDYDVSLVIDCSGSMKSYATTHYNRMQIALIAAYALGQALDRIGINFEVIGFTSTECFSHFDLEEMRSKGVRFGRYDYLYMPIFKAFDESWGPEAWSRIGYFFEYGDMRQNVDGESVMIAARRLAAQPANGKAMIVLSDGEPACSSDDYAALEGHLKKTVKEIEYSGMKVVGVGVATNSVEKYYTDNVVLNDLSKLPSLVVGRIRDIVLGH